MRTVIHRLVLDHQMFDATVRLSQRRAFTNVPNPTGAAVVGSVAVGEHMAMLPLARREDAVTWHKHAVEDDHGRRLTVLAGEAEAC